jgi:hypothetical protein
VSDVIAAIRQKALAWIEVTTEYPTTVVLGLTEYMDLVNTFLAATGKVSPVYKVDGMNITCVPVNSFCEVTNGSYLKSKSVFLRGIDR